MPEVYKVGEAPWEKQQTPEAQAQAASQEPKTSAAAAGLQGFAQGATLGYDPELQAVTEKGLQVALPQSMGGAPWGQSEDLGDLLDKWRSRDQQLKAEHPIATGVGNVAGAIAMLPAAELGAAKVGLGAAKGASVASNIARAAGSGAALGALQNPEENSSLEENLKARLKNAGYGAAMGGGSQALTAGGAMAAKKLGQTLQDQAIVKTLGANAGQIKTILKKDTLPKLTKFLGDEGLTGVGTGPRKVMDATKQIMNEDGPKIASLYDQAQQDAGLVQQTLGLNNSNTAISGPQLADDIMNKVKLETRTHANRDMVIKEMETSLQPLRDLGDNANIKDLHAYRKSLDENINFANTARERPVIEDAYVTARNMVNDKTQDTINQLDKILGGNKLDELKALNSRFSNAATANNIATQATGREMAKTLMGHGVIGGMGGMLAGGATYEQTHDPVKAAAAGLLGMAGTTLARKTGVPIALGAGKVLSAGGRAAEALSPTATARIPQALTAPWLMMGNENGR